MACTLTRNDVSEIVLTVLRRIHRDNSITEFSRFGIELMVDPFARATLYPAPITDQVRRRGCFLTVFGPSDCQRAQDVEDIVTAAWNDVKASQRSVAMASGQRPGSSGRSAGARVAQTAPARVRSTRARTRPSATRKKSAKRWNKAK